MMETIISLLEKFGLPTVFCVYLMVYQQRRQDRQLAILTSLTTVVVVLAKVWDVDVDAILRAQSEDDGRDDESQE